MSLQYPSDTLAHYINRPLINARSMFDIPCSTVADALGAYIKKHSNKYTELNPVYPESDALRFYQLNHAFALISQTRLPDEPLSSNEKHLVGRYFSQGTDMALRAFYYLLIICTREARHLLDKPSWSKKIGEKYTPELGAYIQKLPPDAEEAMNRFRDNPPPGCIGHYVSALRDIYYEGVWSGAYGGKKWGVINDVLLNCVAGKTSLEVLLDNVWSLRHNTAPIFNKGMLYNHDSGEMLVRILDCQRAGLIPTMIKSKEYIQGNHLMTDIREDNKVMFATFKDLPETLDHQKIKDLGAVLYWPGATKAKSKTKSKIKMPSVGDILNSSPTTANDGSGSFTGGHKSTYQVHPGLQVAVIKRAA